MQVSETGDTVTLTCSRLLSFGDCNFDTVVEAMACLYNHPFKMTYTYNSVVNMTAMHVSICPF